MPLHESDAIILRTYPLGEADRIVVFFSRDYGKMRGVAKGARRMKNRFGASLEPLAHSRIIFFEKETRELVNVQSAELLDPSLKLFEDYDRALFAGRLVELVDRFLPEHEPHDEVFRLTRMTLKALESGCALDFASCYFEVWMLKLAGVFPDMFTCSGCGRRMMGDEARFLKPGLQAIVCERCQPQSAEVEAELLAAVRLILKKPLEGSGPESGLDRLNRLNRYWIEHYLQR